MEAIKGTDSFKNLMYRFATLKDEAKALDRKLTDMVLDLGWDCQRMSQSGLATYNAICRTLNIEEYKEEYEEAT